MIFNRIWPHCINCNNVNDSLLICMDKEDYFTEYALCLDCHWSEQLKRMANEAR